MPVYEYTCKDCNHAFEQFIQAQREERSIRCPSCGGKVERQFSVISSPRVAPDSSPTPPGPCGQCGQADGSCPFQD